MQALLTLLGIFVGAFITLLVQMFDRKDKYRLIAIEKRLEAHQRAFILWFELLNVIHKPDGTTEKTDVINRANDFWVNNALYLEKNTRHDFREAANIVAFYKQDLEFARTETDPVE